jgi:hypothetical protein
MASESNIRKSNSVSAVVLASELLSNPFTSDLALAEKFGVCRQTIAKQRSSEEFRALMVDLSAHTRNQWLLLRNRAISKMSELIDCSDPKIAFVAASFVIENAGQRLGFLTTDDPMNY